MPRRKQLGPGLASPPRLQPPERRVQARAAGDRLDEYLTRRETAQTVPPRQALSTHPEIPDTLQAKPAPQALAARLRRAHLLGHRWTG